MFLGTQKTSDLTENKLLGKRILIKELENLSSEDSNKDLARGIQNQLISALSPTVLLPVVPKEETDQINSKNIPLEDLKTIHNVGFVISGSTLIQGKKFQIVNLELLDVEKQKTVWSYMKDFSTDDCFGAQDEIEFDTRKAIQEKFTMGEAFSDSFVKYFGKESYTEIRLKLGHLFKERKVKHLELIILTHSKKLKTIIQIILKLISCMLSPFIMSKRVLTITKEKNILKSVRLANTLDPSNSMAYPVKAFIEYRYAEETNLRSVNRFHRTRYGTR